MTKIDIKQYDEKGKEAGKITISTSYKDLKLNSDLIHQVVVSYQSNARQPLAHTKTRAEVKATGKKPYRQKGTGSARFGSLVTPIHKGGGIAFGPRKERNYDKKINKKMRRKALAIALNSKNQEKEVFAISPLSIEKPNTKNLLSKISTLPLKDGNILIVSAKNNKNVLLSSRNVNYVQVKQAVDLNCLDLLNSSNVIIEKESEKTLSNIFSNKPLETVKTK